MEPLEPAIQQEQVTGHQIQQFALRRIAPLTVPASAAKWSEQAGRLRRRVLDEIVFHGWPREWTEGPVKYEDLGYLPGGDGYRMRKLRYEIVPGMQSTAILYEPAALRSKMPAILNVNGHDPAGKAAEYKQKRCINQARMGILALSPEFIYMGELEQPGNSHWYGAHLEVTGLSDVGLFYLAMKRALDYVYQHPNVDRERIGMTGLSGGGWQTMMLGGLDPRIAVAVPVAGYTSFKVIASTVNTGDHENAPTDLFAIADYTHLTAMRAPRPTFLVYNADDNCCFRAPQSKELVYRPVTPFFRLFGKEDSLHWHENADPGNHNYQLENRVASYRFFARWFGLTPPDAEIPVDAQVMSRQELAVGLPNTNLTILSLAQKVAAEIRREPLPAAEEERKEWAGKQRALLEKIVRYRSTSVANAWMIRNSLSKGLETHSYLFEFDNGLSATGTWCKATTVSDQAPNTIVLSDEGKQAGAEQASERLNRGEQVTVVDLLFTGDAAPPKFYYPGYDRMLAGVGERALGIRAAQLIAIAQWLGSKSSGTVRLEVSGMRSQMAATVAAALRPALFSEIVVRKGIGSLSVLVSKPVEYAEAPELFCLDLLRYFDIDILQTLAAPVRFVLPGS